MAPIQTIFRNRPLQGNVLRGDRAKLGSRRTRQLCVVRAEGKPAREPWDFTRFVKTVLFFNEPPKPVDVIKNFLELPVKMLTSVSGGPSPAEAPASKVVTITPTSGATRAAPSASAAVKIDIPADGVILVTGATGGVGRRVVARLLLAGRRVRALVRDVEKAKTLLSSLPLAPGARLEVVGGDITQRKTLLPEMFAGVRAVVSASAVKVAPKEGDTPDRAKYYQGIKFYDPEIIGDTPETVEYIGLRNVVEMTKAHVGVVEGQVMLAPKGSPGAPPPSWGALDDVVMGGVSSSEMVEVAGAGENGQPAMVFRGTVSTNNSGGFASVRCRNWVPVLDAGGYEGIELRLKGNGLRYKAIIRTDANWDGIGYCKSFDTSPDGWQTIRLPFSSFQPVFRAQTVKGGAPLDPSSISSLQLMLSKFEYDGQLSPAFRAGAFDLPIARIRTYLPESVSPRFVHVSSAGVTRPNRPGINVDVEPPAVKLNDALGGLLTWKLAGEDVVRGSGMPAAVVRPTALTEEPAGAPLEVDQGDVIKGKISREDVADLCVSLLGIPAANGTTFEIKSTVPFSTPWTTEAAAAAPPRQPWAELLASAGVAPGVTGKTVDGVYSGKQKEAEVAKQAQLVRS